MNADQIINALMNLDHEAEVVFLTYLGNEYPIGHVRMDNNGRIVLDVLPKEVK